MSKSLVATILIGCLASSAGGVERDARDPLKPTGSWSERTFGSAPLPPMGWNSWNAFHTQIDEAKLMGAAQTIVSSGLRDLGYRFVNIDDGWWQKRHLPDARMVVRTSIFPSAREAGRGTDQLQAARRSIARDAAEGRNLHGHRPQCLFAGLPAARLAVADGKRRRTRGRVV